MIKCRVMVHPTPRAEALRPRRVMCHELRVLSNTKEVMMLMLIVMN
jgi:hypothetical protein